MPDKENELSKLKEQFENMGEPDRKFEGLPLASDRVLDHLLDKFGADGRFEASLAAHGFDSNQLPHPYAIGMDITSDIFGRIGNIGEDDFVEKFTGWLLSNGRNPDQLNGISVGAGIVLAAFQFLEGPEFIDSLAKPGKTEWAEAFKEAQTDFANTQLIIKRKIGGKHIPQYQFGVNAFLDVFTTRYVPSNLEHFVGMGADGMYTALEYMWGKGYINKPQQITER